MNQLVAIARAIKAAIVGAFANSRAAPPAPRAKLNGRRGYGDNDIGPPESGA